MGKTRLIIKSSDLNSKGEARIFVRYSHGDKTADFATGEVVEPKFWDRTNQRVRKSYLRHNEINTIIEQVKNEVDNIRINLKVQKIDPTTDKLKSEYRHVPAAALESKSSYLLDHWKDFINHKTGVERISTATLKHYNVTKSVLIEFEMHISCALTFDMIDKDFANHFTQYCYEVKEYTPNSLGSRVKHIKSFMSWAVGKVLTSNEAFKKFKKPTNETSIVALSIEQLDHLFKLDLSGERRLERARDIFILGCSTGLRFSDYSVIVGANIKDDSITISTEKMDQQVRIPLNDYSRFVIQKYPNGLPSISNVNLNKFLKELGIRAKFFEEHEVTTFKRGTKVKHFRPLYSLLTTHTARRTFATQSLQRGMDPLDIMKVTGHRDWKSFQRYVHFSQARLKDVVKNAWAFKK